MDNIIVEFFKHYSFLQLKDLMDIYKVSSLKTYKSGEIIARRGDYFPYTLAIRKGIIRTYFLNPEGEEKTVRIAKEGDFAACAESFIRDKPSKEFIQAVEECKVILVDTKRIKSLTKENIRLLRLWNDALMDAFLEAINRIEFFVILSPQERYNYLLKESPDLLNRVPQKYLASYIGVSPVSLSRIRSRVSKK